MQIHQFSSVAQWCLTPCDPMDYSMLGFPVCHQPPELAQTHIHRVGDAIQPSHPLPSPSIGDAIQPSHPLLSPSIADAIQPSHPLPSPSPSSIFPSIQVFSNESVHHIGWSKYCSFSFSICPSNEYSGLISWFDLLAVQKTLMSLLQYCSSNASIL